MTIPRGYGDFQGPKTITVGTSHFRDSAAAIKYYEAHEFSPFEVLRKFREGEIHFGPDSEWENDETVAKVFLDEDGRYQKEVFAQEQVTYSGPEDDIHFEFPKYVRVGHTCLKLQTVSIHRDAEMDYRVGAPVSSMFRFRRPEEMEATYYRAAGAWEVGAVLRGGKVISQSTHPHLHEIQMVEVSQEEHDRDNKGYIETT
jgi:hypothetical protein